MTIAKDDGIAHDRMPAWREGRITVPDNLLELARELRAAQTPAEELLWDLLRGRRFSGMKFRRQHVIDAFVADFYCHDARLIIELDGPIHVGRRDEDCQRQVRLENIGYHVLRFANDELLDDPEAVLFRIAEAIGQYRPPRPPLSPGERGWGVRARS